MRWTDLRTQQVGGNHPVDVQLGVPNIQLSIGNFLCNISDDIVVGGTNMEMCVVWSV